MWNFPLIFMVILKILFFESRRYFRTFHRFFQIRANFGPKWKKPPENGQKFEPITDQGFKGEIEQAMADLLFAVDLKINGII